MGFDISKLTGADGKPVNLEGVDPKVVAALGAVGGAITASVEAALGDGLKAKITEALEPVTTEIAELKKAKPAGDPKEDKTGDTPDDEQPPKWAKSIIDTVTELKTARENETAQTQTQARVKAYLDKNLPRLGSSREIIEKRLVGMGPKDEAAIKAAADAIRAEYTAAGVKTEIFDATPEKEGAKDDPKDDEAREEAKKKELLEKRAEQIRQSA